MDISKAYGALAERDRKLKEQEEQQRRQVVAPPPPRQPMSNREVISSTVDLWKTNLARKYPDGIPLPKLPQLPKLSQPPTVQPPPATQTASWPTGGTPLLNNAISAIRGLAKPLPNTPPAQQPAPPVNYHDRVPLAIGPQSRLGKYHAGIMAKAKEPGPRGGEPISQEELVSRLGRLAAQPGEEPKLNLSNIERAIARARTETAFATHMDAPKPSTGVKGVDLAAELAGTIMGFMGGGARVSGGASTSVGGTSFALSDMAMKTPQVAAKLAQIAQKTAPVGQKVIDKAPPALAGAVERFGTGMVERAGRGALAGGMYGGLLGASEGGTPAEIAKEAAEHAAYFALFDTFIGGAFQVASPAMNKAWLRLNGYKEVGAPYGLKTGVYQKQAKDGTTKDFVVEVLNKDNASARMTYGAMFRNTQPDLVNMLIPHGQKGMDVARVASGDKPKPPWEPHWRTPVEERPGLQAARRIQERLAQDGPQPVVSDTLPSLTGEPIPIKPSTVFDAPKPKKPVKGPYTIKDPALGPAEAKPEIQLKPNKLEAKAEPIRPEDIPAPIAEPWQAPRVEATTASLKPGDTVYHPQFGTLTVTDTSDPAMLSVQNKNGATLKVGRKTVSTEAPEQAPAEQTVPQDTAGQIDSTFGTSDVTATKEPWQMTRDEWAAQQVDGFKQDIVREKALLAKNKEGPDSVRARRIVDMESAIKALESGKATTGTADYWGAHVNSVRQALTDRKQVPANVLADYPELTPAKETASQEQTPAKPEAPAKTEAPTTSEKPMSPKAQMIMDKIIEQGRVVRKLKMELEDGIRAGDSPNKLAFLEKSYKNELEFLTTLSKHFRNNELAESADLIESQESQRAGLTVIKGGKAEDSGTKVTRQFPELTKAGFDSPEAAIRWAYAETAKLRSRDGIMPDDPLTTKQQADVLAEKLGVSKVKARAMYRDMVTDMLEGGLPADIIVGDARDVDNTLGRITPKGQSERQLGTIWVRKQATEPTTEQAPAKATTEPEPTTKKEQRPAIIDKLAVNEFLPGSMSNRIGAVENWTLTESAGRQVYTSGPTKDDRRMIEEFSRDIERAIGVEESRAEAFDKEMRMTSTTNDRGIMYTVKTPEAVVNALLEMDHEQGRWMGRVYFEIEPTAKQKTDTPTEPAEAGPKRGVVGGKLASGEVVLTATGRKTTPFPDVGTSDINIATERKPSKVAKKVDNWLIANAIAEARARGDKFNLRQFANVNRKNITRAEKDSAEIYLFGDEVAPVVPSILKDLVTPTTKEVATPETKAPSTTKENPRSKAVGIISGGKVDQLEAAGFEIIHGTKPTGDVYYDVVGIVGGSRADELFAAGLTVKRKAEPKEDAIATKARKEIQAKGAAYHEGVSVKIVQHSSGEGFAVELNVKGNRETLPEKYDSIGDAQEPALRVLLDNVKPTQKAETGVKSEKAPAKEDATDAIPAATPGVEGKGTLETTQTEDVSGTSTDGPTGQGTVRGAGTNNQGTEQDGGRAAGAEPAPKDGRLHGETTVRDEDKGSGVGTDRAGVDTPAGRGGRTGTGRESSGVGTSGVGKNYVITATDELGKGGLESKYHDNIEAIKTVKLLEKENRMATPEEQQKLVKYVGWGGMPQVFDYYNQKWRTKYQELKGLLTEDEFVAARASAPNAHYTSEKVIRAVYEAVERLGFKSGRILEPSMGHGNFFGLMPSSMTAKSKITGIELDTMTGKMAKYLYPQVDVRIEGFEKALLPDNFYDMAISNVPFGNYKLHDPKYSKYDFFIHDYFFAKAIDKVRPGGLVVFITSKGTMDKTVGKVRKYISDRAALVGAIRLPNTAFKQNAHTEVTTDIIVLRKNIDGDTFKGEEWQGVESIKGKNGEEIKINEYFVSHPEMMLGEMSMGGTMYRGGEATLESDGRDIEVALREAIGRFPESVFTKPAHKGTKEIPIEERIPAPGHIKQNAFAFQDGKLYRREGTELVPANLPEDKVERVKGMIQVRDAVRKVLRLQIEDMSDAEIQAAQSSLSSVYDDFVKKHGPLSSAANVSAFKGDPDAPLLLSVESYDKESDTATKAAIFSRRTMQKQKAIERVETAKEALVVSLNETGGIDWGRMENLTGKSSAELQRELAGVIYNNPEGTWETADGYLSGNVRHKLKAAEAASKADPAFNANVEALQKVQPEDLKATEIVARLGSSWIPAKDVNDFVEYLMDRKGSFIVNYAPVLGMWTLETRSKHSSVFSSVENTRKWGTKRYPAIKLIDDALNLRTPTVYDTTSSGTSVINEKETLTARNQQNKIKDGFKRWLWDDTSRRQRLVRKYNDEMNNIRDRAHDGSHLTLPGISSDIALYAHQLNAVWRIIQSGNTLLAHVVGAGKTYVMIAAGMEMKRLGLRKKNMYAVPNHMLQQFTGDFLKMYPGANVLLANKEDFAPARRKYLMSRIATGDWDAVVVAHSSFEKIPVSDDTMREYLAEQIQELVETIISAKAGSGKKDSRVVKELEKSKKRLEAKLMKMVAEEKKDDTVTFEELGVDQLFVDEAHGFKNLYFATKMNRVAGIPQSKTQKAIDMHIKTKYVTKLNNGSGVVFATGTPISNTMAELYTMQRYLQFDTMKEYGISHFDAWAANFGEATTSHELAPDGSTYRENTRFNRFVNLPELRSLFRLVADIQTNEMIKLKLPRIAGGKAQIVVAKASKELEAYVQDLAERAEAIKAGRVDKSEDNMLLVTGDGKKAALDMRLVDPQAREYKGGKVTLAAQKIYQIWWNTMSNKSTQLVFCDMSTPKKKGEGYSAYNELKEKLIKLGIPAKEIAFIHDAKNDEQKQRLFNAVSTGKVRVLIGSTGKMGAGTNVQELLIAEHHLDAPWRPSDIEQREGRILRQGNTNEEVQIYRYVTEGSFDAYLWQILENKAIFINQFMAGKNDARTADDLGEVVLSYAETKALASKNPMVIKKINIDAEVRKHQVLLAEYSKSRYEMQDIIANLPESISYYKNRIKLLEEDRARYKDTSGAKFGVIVDGKTYNKRKDAGKAVNGILDTVNKIDASKREKKDTKVGEFAGFDLVLSVRQWSDPILYITGNDSYRMWLHDNTPLGTVQTMENIPKIIDNQLADARNSLKESERKLESLKVQVTVEFEHQDKLNQLIIEQQGINALLSGENVPSSDVQVAPSETQQIPSIRDLEQELATKVDESVGEVTPKMGLAIKIVGGGKPSKDKQQSKHSFSDPDIEARWLEAKGVPKEAMGVKVRAAWANFIRLATREYEHLPRTGEFSRLRFDLARLQKYVGVAGDRTKRMLQAITLDTDKEQYDLFTRKVIIDDLVQVAQEGKELPFGFTPESLEMEAARVNAAVLADPDVGRAVALRTETWEVIKADYIQAMKDIGFNTSKRLTRKDYFRHQVLEYMGLRRANTEAGKKLRTPTGRGFLKQRKGSALDINTEYIQAEHEVMAQMLYDIETARVIKSVDENYNIVAELKAEYGKKWREHIPEGYTTWQPREGTVFYIAASIPEAVAEQLYTGAMQELGVKEEDLRKVLAMGQRFREFVVKEEVAATLDDLVKSPTSNPVAEFVLRTQRAWKAWQLVSPRRWFKYNFRNITGDLDALIAADPTAVRKIAQATKELYRVYAGDGAMTPNMRDWFERGGMQTLLQAQELGDINQLEMFADLTESKGKITEIPLRIWQGYWKAARMSTDFREAILRYTAYLHYLEQMQNSPDGMPKNFGASIPDEVTALDDAKDRAFKLSNEALGAYDQVGVIGQGLRNYVIPFWSWNEVNFRRYKQLIFNAANDKRLAHFVGGSLMRGLRKSPFIAYNMGKLALKILALWLLLTLWNTTRHPELEDRLSENERRLPHIVFGQDPDGDTLYFNRLGAFQDFVAWAGVDAGTPQDIQDVLNGKKTLRELAVETVKSPINKFAQGVGPFIKLPAELAFGERAFPDIFRTVPIRDRGLYIAQSFGLENEYKAIMELPSRPYEKSLRNFFVYTVDPQQNSYYSIQEEKRRYQKEINKYSEGSFRSPKGDALYNYKLALRYEDKEAAEKYLLKYIEQGGTKKGLAQSLKSMHPLHGLNKQDRATFVARLTKEQRKELDEAIRFYETTLLGK